MRAVSGKTLGTLITLGTVYVCMCVCVYVYAYERTWRNLMRAGSGKTLGTHITLGTVYVCVCVCMRDLLPLNLEEPDEGCIR